MSSFEELVERVCDTARACGHDVPASVRLGAESLWRGRLVETSEGTTRTLMATVAAACAAQRRRRTHLMTLSDGLATRAAALARPIFAALGHEVSALGEPSSYDADLVCGAWPRFAQDHLRDHRAPGAGAQRTRPATFLIVDHVDAVALDLPMQVLSTEGDQADPEGLFPSVVHAVDALVRGIHFDGESFTEAGFEQLERALDLTGSLHDGTHDRLLDVARMCLRARSLQRGRDYLVRDGRIVVLDVHGLPSTRRLPFGLHQAVEAREHLPSSPLRVVWGRLPFRGYARTYRARAGLLTSALGIAEEMERRYGMSLVAVPTQNEPVFHPDASHPDRDAQVQAIVDEAHEASRAGHPVLIGVQHLEDAQAIADRLALPHRFALPDRDPGEPTAITIAVGARRGVPLVSDASPWRVLGCGRYGEPRFDALLVAQTGDQETRARFHLSPDDELFERLGADGFSNTTDLSERARRCQARIVNREATRRAARARLQLFVEEQQVAFLGWRQQIVRGRGLRDAPEGYVRAIHQELARVGLDDSYARFGVQLDDAEDTIDRAAPAIASGLAWQRNQLRSFFSVLMRDVLTEAREIGGPLPDAIVEAHQALVGTAPARASADVDVLVAPFHAAMRAQLERVPPRIVLRHFRLLRLFMLDRAWVEHLELAARLRDGISADARAKGRPLARYRARLFAALADAMADARARIARPLIASMNDDAEALVTRCRALRDRWDDFTRS